MKHLQTPSWSTLDVWSSEVPLNPACLEGLGWVEEDVARVEWLPGLVRISVGPFVGRLIVPELLTIDILELVPGTTAALLPLANGARRMGDQVSPRGVSPTTPWLPMAARFATVLSRYAKYGIDRRYLQREIDSPFVRGRVNIGQTLRKHRIRGRTDALSCSVRELSDDGHLNRVLLSAAVKAEALLRGTTHVRELRALRQSMRSFGAVMMQNRVDLEWAREEALSTIRPVEPELVELAEILITGIAASPADHDVTQPVSSWINLDSVFEQAARRLITRVSGNSVRFGGDDEVPLLRDGEGLGAEPDIVVETDECRLLFDAKYRRHGSRVGRDELYQLMAHADAYDADEATLIVPRIHSNDADRFFGFDSRGCAYRVAVIDANDSERMSRRLAELVDDSEPRLSRSAPVAAPAAIG
jgi:hypothetical protein